jgi:purine-binding chemotaxis protein CheW
VLWERTGEVPVFSLAALLGRSAAATHGQHLVVLDTAPAPAALMVDHVSQVQRVPADTFRRLPPWITRLTPCFDGVLDHADEMMLVLSVGRVIPGAKPEARGWVASTAAAAPEPWTAQPGRASQRLIVFQVADAAQAGRPLSFGLDLLQVLEILAPESLLAVPGTPEYVRGLFNWRNRPVPIIDLARRLCLPAGPHDAQSRVLIARAGAELVGILIRPAVRLLQLPVPHAACRRQFPSAADCLAGAVELAGETLAIPDLAAMVRESSRCA